MTTCRTGISKNHSEISPRSGHGVYYCFRSHHEAAARNVARRMNENRHTCIAIPLSMNEKPQPVPYKDANLYCVALPIGRATAQIAAIVVCAADAIVLLNFDNTQHNQAMIEWATKANRPP